MISVSSTWELLDGCPPPLLKELQGLAAKVKRAEPDTWWYIVSVQAPTVLDANAQPIQPAPAPIPPGSQQRVTFVEGYRDEVAFSRHINGRVFQTFLKDFGKYFKQDPDRPGWPVSHNDAYARVSGFVRKTGR